MESRKLTEWDKPTIGEVLWLISGPAVVVFVCVSAFLWGEPQYRPVFPQVQKESVKKVPKKLVQILDEGPMVEGMVVEDPISLGGGICLVGVSIDDFHDGRDVRAVLASADRPLVVGQKVKVKVRLVSETYRPAIDLLVIQDDIPK